MRGEGRREDRNEYALWKFDDLIKDDACLGKKGIRHFFERMCRGVAYPPVKGFWWQST
jgi:hypothetical protein